MSSWPMCGAPTEYACVACTKTGRICYHDRDLNAAYEAAANEVDDRLEACHCGEDVRYGYDDDPTHTRGMCDHCDSVRCDAYPGECGRR